MKDAIYSTLQPVKGRQQALFAFRGFIAGLLGERGSGPRSRHQPLGLRPAASAGGKHCRSGGRTDPRPDLRPRLPPHLARRRRRGGYPYDLRTAP